MVGTVSRYDTTVLICSGIAAAPVVAQVIAWLVLACGRPYPRARLLATRFMKGGFVATGVVFPAAAGWALLERSALSLTAVRLAFITLFIQLVSMVVMIVLDAVRGRSGARVSDGDAP